MKTIHAVEEREIAAPAGRIYECLADYRNHHFKFLPPAFAGAAVEEGGMGAGTILRASVMLGGRTHPFRARVEEPEPGRILTETDLATGSVTTFTLTPRDAGTLVRFETRFQRSTGLRGLAERLFVPRILRRLYRDELARLDVYVRTMVERDDAGILPTIP
jgi:hypothetical protein